MILVEINQINNMEGVFQAKRNIIEHANQGLSTILNRPLESIIGQPIVELFGQENKINFQKIDQILSNKGATDNTILLKSTPNLPNLVLHLTSMEGVQKDTFFIGSIRLVALDKTDQPDIDSTGYTTLFDNSSDSIIVYNYNTDEIVAVNAAVVNVLEYDTKEEMLGLSRFQFIPKKSNYAPGLDLHTYTANHKERVLNGESFSTKGILIGKYGNEVICKSTVIPNPQRKGEGMILIQNIVKSPLKETRNLAENKYRNIFFNSHEAIIYIDPANRLPTICNANAMRFFDLTSIEEVRKLRLADFVNEKEIDGISTSDYYDQILEEVIKNGREEVSFWIHKKTGETIRAHAVLVKDNSDPKHPRVICFIRDKTDLYTAQLALKEKNKELEKYIASNLQLENFAYFASHDLQAPLNTILSFTGLLQKKLANDDRKDVAEFLQFIVSSGEGMKTLIDDLLAFSLVNTTNLEITEVSLEKQLYVLLHSLDTVIKEKEARVEMKNIPEAIAIDRIKLKQVFQNLITNGIKFVPPGTKPKVTISCNEDENYWTFSVSDNGIGISKEYHERIFGLFKRLHSSSEYKGTGIGLAIVKKIVEQHKGTIWVVSEIGKGATFKFTIAKDLASVQENSKGSLDDMEEDRSVRA